MAMEVVEATNEGNADVAEVDAAEAVGSLRGGERRGGKEWDLPLALKLRRRVDVLGARVEVE